MRVVDKHGVYHWTKAPSIHKMEMEQLHFHFDGAL